MEESIAELATPRSSGELAPEELVAPVHLATPSALCLGWDGVVLPVTTIIGRRIAIVAELIDSVHTVRSATGWGPVTDRLTVETWHWPEMQHLAPQPAVRLIGAIAPARHWRTALTAATPFAELCATALLLPANIARSQECRGYAERFGTSVLAAAGDRDVDVVYSGRPGPATSCRPSAVSRWVHEVVYELLLATSIPECRHEAGSEEERRAFN